MNKNKNVFETFNRYPFERECKHGDKLVGIYTTDGQSSDYNVCQEHISPPPDDLECHELGERMNRLWNDELKRKNPERASLVLVLFKCLFWDYLSIFFWTGFVRQCLMIAIVESLRRILNLIQEHDNLKYVLDLQDKATSIEDAVNQVQSFLSEIQFANQSSDSTSDFVEQENDCYKTAACWVVCLFISTSLYYIQHSILKLMNLRNGLKCRVAMTQLIYRKSLRLHLATSIEESSSSALSLISNEVAFIEEANKFLVYLVVGPLSILIASIWLATTQTSWPPILSTLPALLIFIAIQLYLPKLYSNASIKRKSSTNNRIETINTFLSSIKIVKMYAWESKFREKVDYLRNEELKYLRSLDKFNIFDLVVVGVIAKLITLIIILAYILTFGELDSCILFTTCTVYNLIKADGLFYFPKGVKSMSDIYTACKNIKRFLLLDEIKDLRTRSLKSGTKVQLECKDLCISLESRNTKLYNSPLIPQLVLKNPKFNVIEKLNCNVQSGDLAFVVGQVGSGKSTLLLSLLGETYISSGFLSISKNARFAYASQEPCIFPASLKNNILNGRHLDKRRYEKVIQVCSLVHDIKLLPNGDATIVGSKGVSLSGGQKARLSLARAIYSHADIYLLDDPLSAVDTKVANHIFNKCIREFLADKLVVLATHQIQFLDGGNKLILLSRNSAPLAGPIKEVLAYPEAQSLLAQMKNKIANSEAKNETEATETSTCKEMDEAESGDLNEGGCRNLAIKSIGRQEGSIYLFLLQLAFTKVTFIFLIIFATLSTITTGFTDYYFRIWSNFVIESHKDANLDRDEYNKGLEKHCVIYASSLVVFAITLTLSNGQRSIGLRRASKRLHTMMLNSLFKAKMSFYDFCEMGELTSRYAADFAIVDHFLHYTTIITAAILEVVISSTILLGIINIIQVIPYAFMFLICIPIMARYYGKLRTLMSLSKSFRSPMYTNISSTIDELSTLRSDEDYITDANLRFEGSQNRLTSVALTCFIYESRIAISLRLVSMLMLAVGLYLMFGPYWSDLNLASTGTFLVLAINSTVFFPTLIDYLALVETAMVSLENVRRLTGLEPEFNPQIVAEKLEAKKQGEWIAGRVIFSSVSLRYFEDEKPAISDLSFVIEGGERVGIVGRTGAGKSSIVSLLYRLYNFEGNITIDGVDIQSLPLDQLRTSLGVIPQDPVLFCDSLRRNLDPFGVYTDEKLWKALQVVNLSDFITKNLSMGLDHTISEGGRNFSAGQRQLVCLARAVLRSPKVLLIDEATANVDEETDNFIQKTIRLQFNSSTIITIAHRLKTILDYDRVMVLDKGKIAEFDKVENLLKLEKGIFRSMLESSSNNEC